MLKRILMSLAVLCSMPLAAQAADFKYTYIEGGYASVNPSGSGSSLTGFGVDGSYALNQDWHALAGYMHVSCCGISENDFNVGAGWNDAIADNVNLYINGEFLSQDRTGPGTHSGWAAEAGLRAALADHFELDGFVNHSDVNSVTENTIGVRGLYAIDMFWNLFASYSNNSDEDTFLVGVRYVF
jgi:hypothetical protein